MLQFSPLGLAPAFSEDASEIERYRARQRLLSRGLPRDSPSSACTEDSDAHDERRRKTSVKWHQQQQHTLLGSQHEDGRWPEPAGTEMRVGFNAFDSSASPEVFDQAQTPATQAETSRTRPCGDDNQRQGDCQRLVASVERAVTSMGFPVLEWAPGLQHPSTLCAYVPLQREDWSSHQRYGLYCHQPRYF